MLAIIGSASVATASARVAHQSALLGSPTALFGSPTALLGSPTALFGSPTALLGSPTALLGSPTALLGSPTLRHRVVKSKRRVVKSKRRVVKSKRRVVKPTRRVVKSTRRVVKSKRRVVKPTRRVVKGKRRTVRRRRRVSTRAVIAAIRGYMRARSDSERRQHLELLERSVSVGVLLRRLVVSEPHQRQPKSVEDIHIGRHHYFVVLPKNYTPRRSWPLHIALHGDGRRGAAKKLCFKYWRGDLARAGIILVCPSLGGPRPPWRSARGEELVVATFKDVQQRFNIRTDRVSLGGYSRGAIGAWTLGPKFVHLWSAISIRAGSPPWSVKLMRNLRYLPVFNIHGSGDVAVKVWGSRRAKKIMSELKYEYIYREVKGAGHNFFPKMNRTVIQWLQRKHRRLLREFYYYGEMNRPARIVHWVKVEGRGSQSLHARALRNVVTLRFESMRGIRSVTVFLNRRLVNLSRPVRVVLNGRVIHNGRLRETVATTMESYRITGDLRRVFSAKVTWSARPRRHRRAPRLGRQSHTRKRQSHGRGGR
ncbi:MAG: hypothetical protein KC609_22410 [Myxococcales bacterium]|nr:hypothetical protein [Myxococcales bacterium]